MPSFDKAIDAIADLREALAAPEPEPVAWEGAEEWEQLAWHLCADENGEDACNELIWEGGPIKEPWGERWLKYEDEAKRMIALVRKYAAPPAAPAPAAPVPDGWVLVPRGLLRRLIAEALTFDPSLQDKEAIEQAKQLAASPAAPVVPLTDEQIDSVIRDVAELDYSSPEGMPDVMLVTADELRGILQARLCEALAAPPAAPAPAAPVVREPFSKAQIHRLYVNSPELHKDAACEAAFVRIVQLAEAAHGITGGKP